MYAKLPDNSKVRHDDFNEWVGYFRTIILCFYFVVHATLHKVVCYDSEIIEYLQFLTWGLRELKDYKLQSVDSPHLEVELAGKTLAMDKIKSVKKHANFDNPHNFIDVMLPVEELYLPPINIRLLDNRWIDHIFILQIRRRRHFVEKYNNIFFCL